MTSTEGAADLAAPPAGGGRILDSCLFISALSPGAALDDVARDTLLIAQREPPTSKTLSSWVSSMLAVFSDIGWTCTQTDTQRLTFGGSKLPWEKPATTEPWASMRTQLARLLSGPITIETVDAFIAGLGALSAADRAQWDKKTVLGAVAVCAVAVAVPSSDGIGLSLTSGSLTYDKSAKTPTLSGFPNQPVPSKGATLTVTNASFYLDGATAESITGQLNDVVEAVLPSIIEVHAAK